jgi:hypothetical protein
MYLSNLNTHHNITGRYGLIYPIVTATVLFFRTIFSNWRASAADIICRPICCRRPILALLLVESNDSIPFIPIVVVRKGSTSLRYHEASVNSNTGLLETTSTRAIIINYFGRARFIRTRRLYTQTSKPLCVYTVVVYTVEITFCPCIYDGIS